MVIIIKDGILLQWGSKIPSYFCRSPDMAEMLYQDFFPYYRERLFI